MTAPTEQLFESSEGYVRGSVAPRLPAGHATIFAQTYQERETRQGEFVTHEVKKGETLFAIARRYGQHVRALMELNGLANPTLRVGQLLKIIVTEGLRGGMLR